MRIDESSVGDVTLLCLKGKMTLGEGDELLKEKLNNLVNQGHTKIILDLANMPFIDSAGNGEIVRSYTTVSRQGGRMVFCNLTKRILDLWSITKLLSVYEIYESIDEAVGSFGAARFEVSCPVCRPTTWTGYLGTRFLLSCTECDARFSPRIAPGVLAPLEAAEAGDTSRVVTAHVSDLWWFTYYENGYGQEGVHLTFGRPSTVAITGRLDLFALDIVQMAWESVPLPRRVMFDATNVRISSSVGRARLNQLCALCDDSSRSVMLTRKRSADAGEPETVLDSPVTFGDRDRAIAALGNLDRAAQSIDVAIRRRA